MWARPARTRMMGWRTNDPTAFFAAGGPPLISEEIAAVVTPIVVSDFRNGVYSLNGVPCTYADLWTYDTVNWGQVLAPVPGVGLTMTLSVGEQRGGPVLTDAAFASLNAPTNNLTVVLEYTFAVTGTAASGVFFEANDNPLFHHGVGIYAQLGGDPPNEGVQLYNYPAAPIVLPNMTPGRHKSAGYLNFFGVCGLSTDGDPTTTGDNDDDSRDTTRAGVLVTVIAGTGTGTATLHSVTIYPERPLAELPTLSAL